MSEILATAEFSSVIHNNEVCEEIVKWGNKNGYPLTKAKLYNSLGGAYVGFAPGYLIKATRRPPVPGGWDVSVETYDAETRIIPLNVNKETGEANRFILKMIEEYKKEGLTMEMEEKWYESYGLTMEMEEKWYESYGTYLRDLKVTGHPILINAFEDFIENMR